jgi:dihydrofolate reductase
MIISLIAAASTNNVIGKEGKLLWSLPNDMKFFKNTTWGMPVIMGRKTFDALAGEPLPGRFNFVITRNKDWDPGMAKGGAGGQVPGIGDRPKVQVAGDLGEALRLAGQTDCKESFVIGGGEIYAEAMPLADKIYLTRVHMVVEGDAYFPVIDEKVWEMTSHMDFPVDDKHAFAYSFQGWEPIRRSMKPNK